MKIEYKKKRLRINLIMGLIWLSFFMLIALFTNDVGIWNYGYLIFGLSYLGIYFYDSKNQYLEIKGSFITKKFIQKKHFNLEQLSGINRKFGNIKLLSKTQKTLYINTEIIDKDSLKELNTFLESFEYKLV